MVLCRIVAAWKEMHGSGGVKTGRGGGGGGGGGGRRGRRGGEEGGPKGRDASLRT